MRSAMLALAMVLLASQAAVAQSIAIQTSPGPTVSHHDSQVFGDYDYVGWTATGNTQGQTLLCISSIQPNEIGAQWVYKTLGTVYGSFSRSDQATAGGWGGAIDHCDDGYVVRMQLWTTDWFGDPDQLAATDEYWVAHP